MRLFKGYNTKTLDNVLSDIPQKTFEGALATLIVHRKEFKKASVEDPKYDMNNVVASYVFHETTNAEGHAFYDEVMNVLSQPQRKDHRASSEMLAELGVDLKKVGIRCYELEKERMSKEIDDLSKKNIEDSESAIDCLGSIWYIARKSHEMDEKFRQATPLKLSEQTIEKIARLATTYISDAANNSRGKIPRPVYDTILRMQDAVQLIFKQAGEPNNAEYQKLAKSVHDKIKNLEILEPVTLGYSTPAQTKEPKLSSDSVHHSTIYNYGVLYNKTL